MTLTTIRYFASVREAVGCASEAIELPNELRTLGQVRGWLAARDPRHADALGASRTLRVACDHVMAGPDDAVVPGREIAFFPPVTGG